MRGLAAILALVAGQAWADAPPVAASYAQPTDRYGHNIMGRIKAWGRLEVDLARPDGKIPLAYDQPQSRVFEDFAPRLWDVTGDGLPEVVTVESDLSRGARLAVWTVTEGHLRRLAMTEYLGSKHRWLAPIGVADFDGDGALEIAYVEKPHLTRILRLVRPVGDQLVELGALAGVTNHAIGQEQVESLIRLCDGVAQIIALSAEGQQVLAVTWDGKAFQSRQIGQALNRKLPAALAPC